ncbi:hypothetical protein DPMN_090649 [Dreissena polymorpha]|uniref:Uncharacterized protein n=1 Tax=Dreissena polymorpha TaxID=45954 RepID=A0A9D4KYK9_DREPO|nr:hypothetical protein DPMN_090649 [Dreissena polymorpha]
MPRKGKKATDTAKTSGKCTVAKTEVTVSPQEERNDPHTSPIELVEEHHYFPNNQYRFKYKEKKNSTWAAKKAELEEQPLWSSDHLIHNCNCSISMMIKVISEQQCLKFLFSKFQYTTGRDLYDCSTTITIWSCEDLVAIKLRSTWSS